MDTATRQGPYELRERDFDSFFAAPFSVLRDGRPLGRVVAGLMLHAIIGALSKAGYTHVGGTWIADGNPASLRQAEKIGARPYQRLHLYRRSLAAQA